MQHRKWATAPLSLWTKRRNAEESTTSKAYENKKTFIKIILAGNFLCIYNGLCQLYDTEHLAATPRRSEDGGPIDLDEDWNQHGFDEKLNLAAREVQVVWQVLPASRIGQLPASFRSATSNAQCQRMGSKPGHWCFLGPASENSWWNGNSHDPQGK